MKKIILCTFFLGFIYAFGATDTKAQGDCKNYLGRPNQSLCQEKKDYDECVVLLKQGKKDLCVWTGDPMSRIERIQSRPEAAANLKEKGCIMDGTGIWSCDKSAYYVCVGYKNYTAVKGCQLVASEKEVKAKRPDAFQLGAEMGRLLYFAAITEAEWKKDKQMNGNFWKQMFEKRKTARNNAEKAVLAINAAIPDKSQQLNPNDVFLDTDGKHEGTALADFTLVKMKYGATLTKNYKVLSDAFYLGFDMGTADAIVQSSDAARRKEAADSIIAAGEKAKKIGIYNSATPPIADLIKTTNPLVNVYIKVFDLRTWYREAIGKV